MGISSPQGDCSTKNGSEKQLLHTCLLDGYIFMWRFHNNMKGRYRQDVNLFSPCMVFLLPFRRRRIKLILLTSPCMARLPGGGNRHAGPLRRLLCCSHGGPADPQGALPSAGKTAGCVFKGWTPAAINTGHSRTTVLAFPCSSRCRRTGAETDTGQEGGTCRPSVQPSRTCQAAYTT